MSSKLILYGVYMSPPVRAVLLTLKALELDYEFKEINVAAGEHLQPEYLQKNPQHTMPLLEDDGKCIWDSHAIIAYLVRKYAKDDSLYPKDFYERAVVDQRLHFENGVLFTACIRQLVAVVFHGTPTKEVVAERIKAINEAYETLEKFFGDHEYFAGNKLTIADFSIVSSVSSLAPISPVDVSKTPKLAAWFERMKELPYYEEVSAVGIQAIVERIQAKLADLN
ncbi:glutathione S-transferase 1-like [Teleopsis dalmanni]|uniref:glutathione S-transferase 1-like n=1 Tax=Teleopsis dalmanni TaxID=139649 RepID=UPI0018CF2F49|nr:glutathione S-transferase 1-like [Teleopsis dalmanni]